MIAAAGTSDMPVVEEAQCTVEMMGHPCSVINDVGVAGIHRLFAYKNELHDASVIIAVAGMEGALPSVMAGWLRARLSACPRAWATGRTWAAWCRFLPCSIHARRE